MGGEHSSVWFVFLPFSNGEGSFFGLHFLKIAIVGNIHCICFGGAFMIIQSSTQDRMGFFPILHTVRYFCETFISPYGFHFYTTTVRSFECNTPKEYTVRYNTSLSPTRGGGSSPSGSIPRPSPLVKRACMCSHSLTISNLTLPRCHVNFRVSKSFESRTVVRYLHCTGFLSYRTGFS